MTAAREDRLPGGGGWFVVLVAPGRIPSARTAEVGGLLGEACQMPFADGTRAAHRCQGIIPIDLTEPEAERIVNGLHDLGFGASRVRAGELEPLPAVVECRQAAMDAERFMPVLGEGPEAGEWPWADVAVVCVGEIETVTTSVKTTQGTSVGRVLGAAALGALCGLPLPLPRQTSTVRQETVESKLLLDIVTRSPMMRFRINSMRFDYSVLGEGKAMSHLLNFTALVRKLIPLAWAAATNVTAEVLAASPTHPWEEFDEAPEFEARARWLLHIGRRA